MLKSLCHIVRKKCSFDRTDGFFTMTMFAFFRLKIKFQSWIIHLIGQIWYLVTSGFSQNQKLQQRHRFSGNSDIQTHVVGKLKCIPEDEFHKCFKQCQHRLMRCIAVQRKYFENPNYQIVNM